MSARCNGDARVIFIASFLINPIKKQILYAMKRLEKLRRYLRFDDPPAAFELLETEHGKPSFFTEWRDARVDEEPETNDPLGSSLAKIEARWRKEYHSAINADLIFRRFYLGGEVEALAVFVNGMVKSDAISDFILKPSMQRGCLDGATGDLAAFCAERIFALQELKLSDRWLDVKRAVLEGQTAVYIEGCARAVVMDTRGFPTRQVSTPQNEAVVMGPHEAFTESIRTNVSLLRRIICTDDLVCEFRDAGGQNKSRLVIAYRQGVANPALVNEVKKRFSSVDALMTLSIGTLEQLTEKHSFSPLPQSLTTERPDRVAAQIMQGHVAVILDGSPLVNVMPATLFSLMTSGQDAYMRQPVATIARIVRYIGAFLSIVMPAYFLALALHHQGMLSGEVLSTVVASRNMVFLSLGTEMLFLLTIFQLLREAGLAVPGALGHSIGIIGGLVLGQAAVSANIVSKVVLIIVALSGLGNFTIPDYSTQLAVTYYRVFLLIMAWIGGLHGMSCAIILTVAYLVSLKSYGVPFLTPASPKTNAWGPWLLRGRARGSKRTPDEMNTGKAI